MKKVIKFLDRFASRILLIWVTILSFLYSGLALIRHNNFQSGAFDLGIFDQAIWQYSRFIYPYNTIKERFILGDHLTLTLPLFASLFYIWDDVRILLVVQAVWIAISAVAIYRIALIRNFSPFVSLCISFVYSIFYGIQFGAYFDWHPIIFGVGLLAWVAYLFESKKKKMFWVTLLLMLLTQENMGIGLACLGLIYFFNKNYRKQAMLFIVGGILITLISIFIINSLSPVGYQYKPKISQDPAAVLGQFYNSHDKRLVWLYSFAGFSFLPVLSVGSVLAVIFDLTQYFAAANEFGHMLTPYLHHRAILGVFLAMGTLDSLSFLRRKGIKPVYPVIVMVVIVISLQYILHFPLNKLTKKAYWQSESWMNDNKELIKLVPKDASIAATQHIAPHLTHRKEIYLIWPRKKSGSQAEKLCDTESCWWLDFAGKPEYLIVNLDSRQWITQLLESPENFINAVENMQKAGKITVDRQINSAYLYKVNW